MNARSPLVREVRSTPSQLRSLAALQPELFPALFDSTAQGPLGRYSILAALPRIGSPGFASKLKQAFPLCDNISIDYAVLEKASNVCGIPAGDFGWNDVGSWNALYELLPRDSHGNGGRGEALTIDSERTYFDVEGKLVALLGVKDLVIVDTPDALLIADRGRAQQVGEIVKLLEKQKRDDLL